jgi:hypothetical protein
LVATPNTPRQVVGVGPSTLFQESSNMNDDFEAPSGAEAIVTGAVGINSLGTDCWANWVGAH